MASQPNHDIQFFELDVDGVVVLDEEHLYLVLEDDEVDVPQSHMLHLSLDGGKPKKSSIYS